MNKRISVLQSCVPCLYPQKYVYAQVDWGEEGSHITNSFTVWAACQRE